MSILFFKDVFSCKTVGTRIISSIRIKIGGQGVKKRALDTYLQPENASVPPADTAVKIARALGVSVEYLVTGEDAAIPADIRLILRNLLRLGEKDRKVAAALVRALLDRQGGYFIRSGV